MSDEEVSVHVAAIAGLLEDYVGRFDVPCHEWVNALSVLASLLEDEADLDELRFGLLLVEATATTADPRCSAAASTFLASVLSERCGRAVNSCELWVQGVGLRPRPFTSA